MQMAVLSSPYKQCYDIADWESRQNKDRGVLPGRFLQRNLPQDKHHKHKHISQVLESCMLVYFHVMSLGQYRCLLGLISDIKHYRSCVINQFYVI